MELRYNIPGVRTAIETLRPGARYECNGTVFTAWDDPQRLGPPSWDEIEHQIKKDVEVYNHYLYARNRQKDYKDLADQLDMLYHDIKNNNLENGSWIQHVEEVKSKHPKPE
tara:strand:- start:42 stop:374 length:333 start_codon:yes stop_codon:yes gene_type:complete